MRNLRINKKIVHIITLLLFYTLFFLCCTKTPTERTKIVVTTSLIGTVVKEIGKDRVDVVTIVSAGMCPGHFDVKPGDIMTLTDADALLSHGFEGWIKKLLNATENKKLLAKTLNIEGNWMVPEIHKNAAEKITKVLCELTPQNRSWYEENLYCYEKMIDSTVVQITALTKDLIGIKVVCAEYQSGFLNWIGCKVIATYGRPEELTPKELVEITKIAKREKVKVVVDNLQSGADAGQRIAEEIGASHIILTNFPLGDSYVTSLRENVDKIVNTQ